MFWISIVCYQSWKLLNGIFLIPIAYSEYPMDTLLSLFLNRSFLDKVEKNQKPVFFIPSRFCILILSGAQNFKFIDFIYSDWLNFIHFSGTSTRKGGSNINLYIHHSKVFCSELKTSAWDILNTDRLIWISNVHTSDFLLNPLVGYFYCIYCMKVTFDNNYRYNATSTGNIRSFSFSWICV